MSIASKLLEKFTTESKLYVIKLHGKDIDTQFYNGSHFDTNKKYAKKYSDRSVANDIVKSLPTSKNSDYEIEPLD